MWPFTPRQLPEDDHRRLNQVVESLESLSRRMTSLAEDVDEYFAKINKARQRVVKEEKDAARAGSAVAGGPVGVGSVPGPGMTKDELRQRVRLSRREA